MRTPRKEYASQKWVDIPQAHARLSIDPEKRKIPRKIRNRSPSYDRICAFRNGDIKGTRNTLGGNDYGAENSPPFRGKSAEFIKKKAEKLRDIYKDGPCRFLRLEVGPFVGNAKEWVRICGLFFVVFFSSGCVLCRLFYREVIKI